MTYTIRDRMDRLRRIEETLPPSQSLWMVSLEDKMRGFVGGRIVGINRSAAAACIEDGSYRLATDEEAAAHEAIEAQKREQARYTRMAEPARQVGTCIVLGPKGKSGR